MKASLTDGAMSIVTQILGCPAISVMTEIKTREASVRHNKGLINGFAAFFTYFFCLFSCKEGFQRLLDLKKVQRMFCFWLAM
jgi:hypothetical protein